MHRLRAVGLVGTQKLLGQLKLTRECWDSVITTTNLSRFSNFIQTIWANWYSISLSLSALCSNFHTIKGKGWMLDLWATLLAFSLNTLCPCLHIVLWDQNFCVCKLSCVIWPFFCLSYQTTVLFTKGQKWINNVSAQSKRYRGVVWNQLNMNDE